MLSVFSNSLCSQGTNISETSLSKYRRFVDILTFISGISIPIHKPGSAIPGVSQLDPLAGPQQSLINSDLSAIYKGLHGVYLSRIPIWSLLDNPWAVLEPIMTYYPDLAAKLTPLCKALMIDKNAYLSKQVMAAYTQSRAKFSGAYSEYVSSSESPYTLIDSGLASITDLTHKVGVLKWVFDQVQVLLRMLKVHRSLIKYYYFI
jgi:hypothetical protein